MTYTLQKSPPREVLEIFSKEFMLKFLIFPIEVCGNTLKVLISDINDFNLIQDLQMLSGYFVIPIYEKEEQIREWIYAYAIETDFKDNTNKLENPTIRLVNDIIFEAIHLGVSDIHFEPREHSFVIRFRKNGSLYVARTLNTRQIAPVTSHLKIMASMDIAEKRRPQDGRIGFEKNGNSVDIRVSALPTAYGQKMVLRLLKKGQIIHQLDFLGMNEAQINLCKTQIHKPYGMFLITGPTGSGKTTTLYTLLQMIENNELNISTIEEPIEYKINGITQTAVNPKIDLTFASALRTLLRQDPDVIMVGEIRDSETAELAIRAALTGHLVFSTLHTNDAPSAIIRLIDMGVEPFLVASAVNFIMAQRLVKKICPHCLGKNEHCIKCEGTGFDGRIGIFEMLNIDKEIKELIHNNAPLPKIKELAKTKGMKTLYEDGIEKVNIHKTTLSEIETEMVMND